MKHNYFVFCTMITLFCFSALAMEKPSKKTINHRVCMAIAQLQGPANVVLEYIEDEYGFKVMESLTKPATKKIEEKTEEIEL